MTSHPIKWLLCSAAFALLISSCKATKDIADAVVPQEQNLRPVKMTDETQNNVVGQSEGGSFFNWWKSGLAGCKELKWSTGRRLAISPDGSEIAYISVIEKAPNVMVKKTTPGTASIQRTFRRAEEVCWGNNNRLYFNDNTGSTSTIGSTDARKGSLIKQHTSNNNDWSPSLTADNTILYFTRYDKNGPYIWSVNLESGELTNCTRGYQPVVVGNKNSVILCTRNSEKGNSEIWMVDLENGDEMLLLSDTEKGFSDPAISPNGKWILVVSNSISNLAKKKKQNTDIYAVRNDGTQLTQITYHPDSDCCPIWSPDGKYIYFLSNRANKDHMFNIWRIENPL